jgi:hypothetical protein
VTPPFMMMSQTARGFAKLSSLYFRSFIVRPFEIAPVGFPP